MNKEESIALIIRSAFRGIVEAVLDEERKATRQPSKPRAPKIQQTASPVEFNFPSVTSYERELFGENVPEHDNDIEMAIAAVQRAREMEARQITPDIQPGPGESEVATGWAIPQP